MERRKTNPSSGFPEPLSPLARTLLLLVLNPLSTPGVVWPFTVRLCFLSKRTMNVKFSKKRRKKKNSTFSFLLLCSLTIFLFIFFSFPIFLFPTLSLVPFLSFPFTVSIQDNAHNKLCMETKKGPGPSLVDPLSQHVVFSQWQLNYIFMVTQIRLACSSTQTRHSAKTPSTHLLVVCLPSRNCSFKMEHMYKCVVFGCPCVCLLKE